MSFIQIIYESDTDNDLLQEKSDFSDAVVVDGHNKTTTQSVQEGFETNAASIQPEIIPDSGTNIPRPQNSSSTPPISTNINSCEWNDRQTKFLLKKYNRYILLLGCKKRFRTKRELWDNISQDLQNELNIYRTASQCENRYKTLLRKWKRQTGKRRKTEIFRNPTVPQVLNDVTTPVFEDTNASSDQNLEASNQKKDLIKVLWEIFKQKEENRERRHKEKMQLLKSLLQNDM